MRRCHQQHERRREQCRASSQDHADRSAWNGEAGGRSRLGCEELSIRPEIRRTERRHRREAALAVGQASAAAVIGTGRSTTRPLQLGKSPQGCLRRSGAPSCRGVPPSLTLGVCGVAPGMPRPDLLDLHANRPPRKAPTACRVQGL